MLAVADINWLFDPFAFEERQIRIEHHNTIWGPLGRNLHEDLVGIAGQGTAMLPGSKMRRILHGRHEENFIHDEVGMRHFYTEWGRKMDRLPSDPTKRFMEGHNVRSAAG